MGPKASVFCHNGLGDGIVSLVLSNQLHLNGWHVDTFQNSLGPLQAWFPHLPLFSYPSADAVPHILQKYDWFFVFQNDTSPFIQRLIAEGKQRFPERVKVLYIYPSRRIVREPYYQDAQIDPLVPVADSLRLFCQKILKLPKQTKSNGCIPPRELHHRLTKSRVVFHPTSSRPGKNWDREKYVKLALHLREMGFTPSWALEAKEQDQWLDVKNLGFEITQCPSLDAMARHLYESGYFVGNDSGLGHLASCLGIPTLTVTRRKALAQLWAPSFSAGIVVTPASWIPNIRGFRLRDRHWQKFISVPKVLRAFQRLIETYP